MAKGAVPIGFFSSFIPSSPFKLVFLGTAPAKIHQIESEESVRAFLEINFALFPCGIFFLVPLHPQTFVFN